MWDLATLRRLNNPDPPGSIRILFLTLVLKRSALADGYPGGLGAFLARYPLARREGGLVAVSAMSGGEIGEIEAHLADSGFDLESGSALGDQFVGALRECPGVAFRRHRPERAFVPGWIAFPAR